MSYFFHPEAEIDYFESVEFYETRQTGLGASFYLEFEATMKDVEENSARFAVVRPPHIRRAIMTRFPFWIIFAEVTGVFHVLAVAHPSRHPDYWISRLES